MRPTFACLISFVIFSLVSIDLAHAELEFPVQLRLFAGSTSVDPIDLNQEMAALGLKQFKDVTKFGIEMTRPIAKYLAVGINYNKRYFSQHEDPENSATDYSVVLNQDVVQGIVRIPFLQSKFLRADVFGGIGGSNTTLKLKTATQNGELTRREGNDWFASMASSYGASVGIGFKQFFFIVEGGFENNKVKDFKRSGNINSNIQEADFSGSYISVGLLFDGVKASNR